MLSDKYRFRELTPSETDLESYGAIFARNGARRDMDILRWRFRDSLTENNLMLLLEDGSTAPAQGAAFYAALGFPFRVEGQQSKCVFVLDALTDKDHRRQGLFTKTVEECYRIVSNRNNKFLYGFPNPNTRDAYERHLAWVMLDPMPFVIRPMRTGYFLNAILGRLGVERTVPRWLDFQLRRFELPQETGIELRPLTEFGDDHDRLWSAFSKSIRVGVERNAAYMNWRVFGHPHAKYRALGVWRAGKLAAEVVWCIEKKHGGSIGYIIELLHLPDDHAAGIAALRGALSHLNAEGAEAVLAWNLTTSPNSSVYQQARFLPLPEKIRPTNIYWGVCCFDKSIEPIVGKRENWYLSYTDSDTT